jgi:predicted small lipoprotein YifL
MRRLAILSMLALAGCGADGEPERPDRASGPGAAVTITGTAEIGVRR